MTSARLPTRIHLSASDAWLEKAADLLLAGGLVAVPTETVYGLVGDATNIKAVEAIYAAKGRPSHNPLIVHVGSLEMARSLAQFPDHARERAQTFWPGPLTMVLDLKPEHGLAEPLLAPGGSVALRLPKGPIATLSAHLNRPLAAPSANRSGYVSATTAQHVLDDLGDSVAMVLDGGSTTVGVESTVIDARTSPPTILRPGAISESALGIERARSAEAGQTSPLAPGMLTSHYAPNARLRLDVLPNEVRAGEAYLGFGRHHRDGDLNLSESGDLAEAATNLFAMLRTIDARKPQGIAVAHIPSTGLGSALIDRLTRAAADKTG